MRYGAPEVHTRHFQLHIAAYDQLRREREQADKQTQ
jgi:hypothetical protein